MMFLCSFYGTIVEIRSLYGTISKKVLAIYRIMVYNQFRVQENTKKFIKNLRD